jgi:hypothetical protein
MALVSCEIFLVTFLKDMIYCSCKVLLSVLVN